MSTAYLLPIGLVIQIILLFMLSRTTINELFYCLRIVFRREHLIYAIVSTIFLPGTIIHEMGHFVAATALMLKVHDVRIFPQWEKNQIKLGSVIYEKKDIFRGILVGIAPLFFGLCFFWFLGRFKLFPNSNLWLNIFFGYIVLTVSSTMFSSKQDLVDLVFIIPLAIIILGLIYIFNLNVNFILANQQIMNGIITFLQEINFYLLFSLIVNLFLIILFKSFRSILKK